MKPGIHPNYREVVFQDLSSGFAFLTRSTIDTKETIAWEDGKDYPLEKLRFPVNLTLFYTGKQAISNSLRRVEKFKNRYVRGK